MSRRGCQSESTMTIASTFGRSVPTPMERDAIRNTNGPSVVASPPAGPLAALRAAAALKRATAAARSAAGVSASTRSADPGPKRAAA